MKEEKSNVVSIENFQTELQPFIEARNTALKRVEGLTNSLNKLRKEVEEKERKLGKLVGEMSYALSEELSLKEKPLELSRNLKIDLENIQSIIEKTDGVELPRLKEALAVAENTLKAKFLELIGPVKSAIHSKMLNQISGALGEGSNFIESVGEILQATGVISALNHVDIIGLFQFDLRAVGSEINPMRRKCFYLE